MVWQNKNFALSTLNGGVLIGASSIVVTTGANFPATGNFMLVIWDQSYANPSFDANRELVLCTARTTDTITITRAQEGTVAKAWNSGDKVAHVYTAALLDALVYLTGAQTLTDKTLTTPTIASFVNAAHAHVNAAGGGTLDAAAIASGLLALARGGLNIDVSTLTGLLKLTAGAATVMTAPASTIVGISDSQTLSNKTITVGASTNFTPATGWEMEEQCGYLQDPMGFIHLYGKAHWVSAANGDFYYGSIPSPAVNRHYPNSLRNSSGLVKPLIIIPGTSILASYYGQIGDYVLLDGITFKAA